MFGPTLVLSKDYRVLSSKVFNTILLQRSMKLNFAGAADGGQEGGGDDKNIDVVPERLRERRRRRDPRSHRVSKCDRSELDVLGGPIGTDPEMQWFVILCCLMNLIFDCRFDSGTWRTSRTPTT